MRRRLQEHKHSAHKICWRCVWFTAGFYVEHFMAEKVFPFVYLTRLLGL